jgi:hypothetical protein
MARNTSKRIHARAILANVMFWLKLSASVVMTINAATSNDALTIAALILVSISLSLQ